MELESNLPSVAACGTYHYHKLRRLHHYVSARSKFLFLKTPASVQEQGQMSTLSYGGIV